MKEPRGKYKHYQVVAHVSPEIRDIIGKHRNRLYIGIESVRVYDRFYVKRCNKCNHFGHYKDDCEQFISCGLCSSDVHETETCPLKRAPNQAELKCVNCMRSGLDGNRHSAS